MPLYGKSKDEMLLKEGKWEIGTWVPGSVTVADPLAGWTPTADLGYFQQGSIVVELNRAYATFKSGTPAKWIRHDLVEKNFAMTAMFAQFNDNLLALAQGLKLTVGANSLAEIGSDEPLSASDRNGFLLTTERVDGTALYVAIYAGQATSEGVGFSLDGTAHATFELRIQAFEHDDFVATPDDEANYGFIAVAAGS